MSGHLLDDPIFEILGVDPTDHPCFYCAEPLTGSEHATGGVVVWHGAGLIIGLHQGCAEQLALHLLEDAVGVKLQTAERIDLRMTPPRPNLRRYHLSRLK